MTKTQLTLQHQGKEMTQGKGISKVLCMNGVTHLYRIAEAQQNSIVLPTVGEVKACLEASEEGRTRAGSDTHLATSLH